jgi:hypothetical protein
MMYMFKIEFRDQNCTHLKIFKLRMFYLDSYICLIRCIIKLQISSMYHVRQLKFRDTPYGPTAYILNLHLDTFFYSENIPNQNTAPVKTSCAIL